MGFTGFYRVLPGILGETRVADGDHVMRSWLTFDAKNQEEFVLNSFIFLKINDRNPRINKITKTE